MYNMYPLLQIGKWACGMIFFEGADSVKCECGKNFICAGSWDNISKNVSHCKFFLFFRAHCSMLSIQATINKEEKFINDLIRVLV